MKRFLSVLLVLTLIMSMVVGCGQKEEEAPVEPEETEDPVVEEEETGEEASDGEIVKLGLGKEISAKATDAEGEDNASAQINTTLAAVGFDAEGKVVSVSIDTIQGKVKFDEELGLETDIDAEVKSKKELGPEYNMKPASEIEKEWDEQMEAFEDWMVGKTVDEIVNLETKERDENHKFVPDVEELTSSVTMTVESYIAAVEDAWNNAIDVEGATTVGLGLRPTLAKSNGLDGEKTPVARLDVKMAATAFDADENVAGIVIDSLQAKVEFDEEGKVTSELDNFKTKKDLQDDYGMKPVSEIEKEWFEQVEAFEDWMVGKSVDEILDMDTKERDENHKFVPDVEELTSSVTITVEGILEAVENSFENRK